MPQHKYFLSLRAEEDLIEIWGYSFNKWGEKQADKYIDDIYERFQWLAKNPHLGKPRSDIEDGYYSYMQGSHLIFYIINSHGISIIGLPHQVMDVINYFNPS